MRTRPLQQVQSTKPDLPVMLQPEGEGKYVWADQSTYEGGWKVAVCCCSLSLDALLSAVAGLRSALWLAVSCMYSGWQDSMSQHANFPGLL